MTSGARSGGAPGNWFVACLPVPAQAAALEAWSRPVGATGEWRVYPAEDLHLTLGFLGPLRRADDVQRLASALASSLDGVPACELALDGLAGFPEPGDLKRVAYARVLLNGENGDWWERTTRAVRAACAAAGYALPRDQVPHVTVARARGKWRGLPQLPPWRGRFACNAVELMGPGETRRYHSFAQVSLGRVAGPESRRGL